MVWLGAGMEGGIRGAELSYSAFRWLDKPAIASQINRVRNQPQKSEHEQSLRSIWIKDRLFGLAAILTTAFLLWPVFKFLLSYIPGI